MPSFLRSILAVLAGFVVTAALSFGADWALHTAVPQAFDPAGLTRDSAMLVTVLGYLVLFSVVGGFVTARLAPRQPLRHALILGVIALVLTLVPTVLFWHATPTWYHFGVLAAILPATWLGGHLRERQLSPV